MDDVEFVHELAIASTVSQGSLSKEDFAAQILFFLKMEIRLALQVLVSTGKGNKNAVWEVSIWSVQGLFALEFLFFFFKFWKDKYTRWGCLHFLLRGEMQSSLTNVSACERGNQCLFFGHFPYSVIGPFYVCFYIFVYLET